MQCRCVYLKKIGCYSYEWMECAANMLQFTRRSWLKAPLCTNLTLSLSATKRKTQKLTRTVYTKAHSMVWTVLQIENYTQWPYITVYRKFWSTHEKDINTHRKRSAIIYASSCSCESSFGEKPREMQRFLRSSGNSVTTTMFSGWNRIWNKNSAFQSWITASCDEEKIK